MSLPYEKYHAQAEDDLINLGYELPVAWALGLIVDHEHELVAACIQAGLPDLADTITRLASEIHATSYETEDENEGDKEEE